MSTQSTYDRERVRVDGPVAVSTIDDDRVRYGVAAALDRVRWAAVLAGIFTVLATIATLAVLGLALGLSTFEAEQAENFGLGAGIYGAITAIVGFLLGGFIAARTGAVAGTGNGLLNGAMVWITTVVLIVNFLGTGIGTLLGTAGQLGTTAAIVADDVASSPVVTQAAGAIQDALPTPVGATQAPADPNAAATAVPADPNAGVAPIVENVQDTLSQVTPQQVEAAARDVSNAAWAALLGLGLTAIAAMLGGILGTRSYPTDIATYKR